MARQHAGSEKTALAETNRFAAELGRLFLSGTCKPEHLPQAPGRDRSLEHSHDRSDT
jgi:hypothetical protein